MASYRGLIIYTSHNTLFPDKLDWMSGIYKACFNKLKTFYMLGIRCIKSFHYYNVINIFSANHISFG